MAKDEIKPEASVILAPKPAFPFRYVCLHAFPKTVQLLPDKSARDATGRPYVEYGVSLRARPIGDRSGLRVVDLDDQSCCKRAQNTFTPQQVQELLLKSKYMNPENPSLIPYDLWKESENEKKSLAEKRAAEDKAHEANLRAKIGKLGVAPTNG